MVVRVDAQGEQHVPIGGIAIGRQALPAEARPSQPPVGGAVQSAMTVTSEPGAT